MKYDPDTDPDLYPEGTDADGAPATDKWPRTRIDLLFKPVDAMYLRQLSYPTLRVQVATERVAEEILDRMHRPHGGWQVLELVGPDGVGDHVVCLAAGYCEDDGECWEPSPYAADLSDGRTPLWRRRVLGGGPDGELTARYASAQEVVTATVTDLPIRRAGDRGRWLYIVMARFQHSSDGEYRPGAVAAFLTRHEAEQRVQEFHESRSGSRDVSVKYWIDAVPIDL
ncbi:hypothetical protein [Micromonospora echinofusca]|uniref:GyrI-like small molecule binding domain-containing protein n=1 Tax=Micromonospora echinofusca TaxID=47858 RepID=A0ABS3VYF1_MICEH|nr:hypothetical protein [Micromonospora echinofusca]MBO4209577.1 hypothetical protein [Micromonospora echinofusca]